MALDVVSRPHITAEAVVGEAWFALRAYAVVGLVGIIVTIGAARLGHPLFGLIADEPAKTDVKRTEFKKADPPAVEDPTSEELRKSGIPIASLPEAAHPGTGYSFSLSASEEAIAKFFRENPAKYGNVITPTNPNIVVGTIVFDTEQNPIGRVFAVTNAPVERAIGGNVMYTGDRIFVTVEDKDGVPLTFDYRRIEWRATSSTKATPDVGVIRASLVPGDERPSQK